jgi:hypothetical protein
MKAALQQHEIAEADWPMTWGISLGDLPNSVFAMRPKPARQANPTMPSTAE